MRTVRTVAAACLAAASLAAPAAAQQTQVAPPGNAGVGEYLETVPGADGPRRVTPQAILEGEGASRLQPRARRRLEALGEDGRAAAALAEAGSPEIRSGGSGGSGDARPGRLPSSGSAPPEVTARADDVGELEVVGRALGAEGGSGLGIALPIVMVLTLLGVVLLRLATRSRTPSGTAEP